MKFAIPLLRIASMLKRIAEALEESNDLMREMMAQDDPRPRQTAKFDISRPTVEQWNDRHRGIHGNEEIG